MSPRNAVSSSKEENKRNKTVIKALDSMLFDELEFDGITLQGFAMKFDAYQCLMTLKAIKNGNAEVAFVGSDTASNCILKALSMASDRRLRWREDRWKDSGD